MNEKERYAQKLESRLNKWSMAIDVLRADDRMNQPDAEENFPSRIAQLERQHAEVRKKLQNLRDAEEGTWHQLQDEIEQTFEDLGDDLENMIEKL